MMRLIHIKKIYHNRHHDVVALDDINLSFANHGMTFIVGESGCGKTSLLNIIADYDTHYQGQVERDGLVECIEQEIHLMENLSVYDNLWLVNHDRERINRLLRKFQLNTPDKKVRKLSVGERKRVQIIRSLLNQASYLICDEPTAALDHDNGHEVMEMLKDVSENVGVIVVTHDLALMDTYSERTIRMGKACILKDEACPIMQETKQMTPMKQTLSKQCRLLLKIMKSNWPEFLFKWGLLFLALILVFILTFLFPSLNGSMKARTNWLNGNNVIVSEVFDKRTTYKEDDLAWLKANDDAYIEKQSQGIKNDSLLYYDLYTMEDVRMVHEHIPGVLGYQIGWNFFKYRLYENCCSFMPRTNITELRHIVNQFQEMYTKTGIEPYSGYLKDVDTLAKYDEAYPNDSFPKDQYIFIDHSHLYGCNNTMTHHLGLASDELYLAYNPVKAYQLFSEIELELSMGKMPIKDDEIIVSKSVADSLMKVHHLTSATELIDRQVYLTYWGIDDHDKTGFVNVPLVVSGITYMDCQFENQIYFMDGTFFKPFIEDYGCQPEVATFQFLDFLIDPHLDSQTIAKQINELLSSQDSRFVVYGQFEAACEAYQDPINIILFVILALLALLFLYLMMQFLFNQRIVKETKILKRYQNHPFFMQMIMMFTLLIVAAMLQICFLSDCCAWLNHFAHSLGFADIVAYDLHYYFRATLLVAFSIVILEGGIYAFRVKKYL